MSARWREESKLSVMQAAFRERFVAQSPFREDRALAVDLAEEGAPVLTALAEVLGERETQIAHEASALLTLLSRRAGVLGATPAAAVALSEALLHALSAGSVDVSDDARRHLTTIVMEGFCAGRDERVTKDLNTALAQTHTLKEIAPRAFLLSMQGQVEPAALAIALEEVERDLLRRDAQALVIELSALAGCPDETIRLVGELCATAHSLGLFVVLACAPEEFQTRAVAQRLDFSSVEQRPALTAAVLAALSACGFDLKARRRWPKPLFSAKRSDS